MEGRSIEEGEEDDYMTQVDLLGFLPGATLDQVWCYAASVKILSRICDCYDKSSIIQRFP